MDTTLDSINELTASDKYFRDFNITVTVFDCDKRDSNRPFINKEEFPFNKNINDQFMRIKIYRNLIEFSSMQVEIPLNLRTHKREENFRKVLSTPERIMEAFSLYLGEIGI